MELPARRREKNIFRFIILILMKLKRGTILGKISGIYEFLTELYNC
jgi:hypothetical protein